MAESLSIVDGDLSLGLDPSSEEILAPSAPLRTAVIRTSDRILFKRCRRRWGWQSHLRGNLGSKFGVGPLWFGSGIHYALEDFHGVNVYQRPSEAFKAYVSATRANQRIEELPADWNDLLPLGIGMMDYYSDLWLKQRDPLKTFIHNGVPQVEVNALVEIDINLFPRWLKQHYDRVLYSATFDRVVEDENQLLWLVDYKTAKAIQTNHYITDPQIGAYTWLGEHLYGRPIAGMLYQQHRKSLPDDPRILADGRISTAKTQLTSYWHYRKAIQNLYGLEVAKWPPANLDFLNWLATEEGPTSDHFIRRDRVERNSSSHQSEGTKILMEIEEMLDPTLPLYPNPTRDCSWCPTLTACVNIDDGSDWEGELSMLLQPRPRMQDSWRPHLPLPQHQQLLLQQQLTGLSQ